MIADSDSYHCRVVLIGDASVGKTSILSQLIDHKFDPNEQSTVGANYQIFIEDFEGQKVEMQIWDTAGQEKFRALGPIYFRNAMGALVVYDQTNKISYENMPNWINSFKDIAGHNSIIFIVANKADLVDEIRVPFSKAQKFAEDNDYQAFETSAKTGKGIPEMFHKLAKTILEERQAESHPNTITPIKNKGNCNC